MNSGLCHVISFCYCNSMTYYLNWPISLKVFFIPSFRALGLILLILVLWKRTRIVLQKYMTDLLVLIYCSHICDRECFQVQAVVVLDMLQVYRLNQLWELFIPLKNLEWGPIKYKFVKLKLLDMKLFSLISLVEQLHNMLQLTVYYVWYLLLLTSLFTFEKDLFSS